MMNVDSATQKYHTFVLNVMMVLRESGKPHTMEDVPYHQCTKLVQMTKDTIQLHQLWFTTNHMMILV